MYYIFIENNKISGIGQCPCLNQDIRNIEVTKEVYDGYAEDNDRYIWDGEQIVENPDYEEKQAEARQAEFLKDFFKVEGYGYYRRQPKGYQSAVESMNVLFNVANITKGVQEGLIIFYQEPDFTKPEQCTEEWLVEHQIIMPALTLEQFLQLYVAFMTVWNTEEHNENTTD